MIDAPLLAEFRELELLVLRNTIEPEGFRRKE
jgi:hypothetical protein